MALVVNMSMIVVMTGRAMVMPPGGNHIFVVVVVMHRPSPRVSRSLSG